MRRRGFAVTALEPVGEGFAHFQPLHTIVLDYATERGFAPLHLTYSAEQLDLAGIFDFAFSVNVMEHVRDFPLVLERVYAALRPGADYRFVCPNYAFPYEPHYNLPTLFSKALTEKLMLQWIMKHTKGLDPAGTWNSLNWISVAKVRRTCRSLLAVEPSFDPAIFNTYLERTLTNSFFRSRRGPMMVAVLNRLRDLGLLKLTRFIPVACLRAMDCTLHRHASMAGGNARPSTLWGKPRARCVPGTSKV